MVYKKTHSHILLYKNKSELQYSKPEYVIKRYAIRFIIIYKNWFLSFQQNAIVLVLVAMATDFEHRLDCAAEFNKPVKFQANPL